MPALVLLALVLAAGALLLGPYVYNHHIFKLGRLRKQIEIGAPCAQVEMMFQDYVEDHCHHSDCHWTSSMVEKDFLGRSIDPTRRLSVYDLSLFDDVQVKVLCGDDDRVTDVLFIGD